MAVKSNLPLNGPSARAPLGWGEGRSDTVSAKSNRKINSGIKAKHKKQTRRSKQSKILDGFKTLYG